MLLGHLAVADLLARHPDLPPAAVWAGSLAPDALDKSLCHALGITANGRMLVHNLAGLGVTGAAVYAGWGEAAARGWVAGFLLHLFCDGEGRVPWLFPFKRYPFLISEPLRGRWRRQRRLPLRPLEGILLVVALAARLVDWSKR